MLTEGDAFNLKNRLVAEDDICEYTTFVSMPYGYNMFASNDPMAKIPLKYGVRAESMDEAGKKDVQAILLWIENNGIYFNLHGTEEKTRFSSPYPTKPELQRLVKKIHRTLRIKTIF